jgi:hypothetical protein
MTSTEKKYEILLDRLRNKKPVADNPDILIDKIMDSIGRQKNTSTPQIFVYLHAVMTTAAIFLLGLLLYQQVTTTIYTHEISISNYVKPVIHPKTNCGSDLSLKLPENSKLLIQYICYMKNNQVENNNSKQLYRKFLPKNRASIVQ